jgi:hypothetical protein
MNCLIKRLFFIVLLLFLNSCTNVSKETVVDFKKTSLIPNDVFSVPQKIKNNLLQQFPSLQIIKKEAYSNLFWDFYDSDTIPYECFTDINNDQILDYAFLVKENNQLKLAIAFSANKDYLYWISPFFVENIKTEGINFCVTIKPAGRTDVVKKVPESLVLKKNGFLLKNLEQDYRIFYETDSKIMIFNIL